LDKFSYKNNSRSINQEISRPFKESEYSLPFQKHSFCRVLQEVSKFWSLLLQNALGQYKKKNQKQLGNVKYWQLMQAEHKEGQWEASVQCPSAQ
jgi:hypothetical protein